MFSSNLAIKALGILDASQNRVARITIDSSNCFTIQKYVTSSGWLPVIKSQPVYVPTSS